MLESAQSGSAASFSLFSIQTDFAACKSLVLLHKTWFSDGVLLCDVRIELFVLACQPTVAELIGSRRLPKDWTDWAGQSVCRTLDSEMRRVMPTTSKVVLLSLQTLCESWRVGGYLTPFPCQWYVRGSKIFEGRKVFLLFFVRSQISAEMRKSFMWGNAFTSDSLLNKSGHPKKCTDSQCVDTNSKGKRAICNTGEQFYRHQHRK